MADLRSALLLPAGFAAFAVLQVRSLEMSAKAPSAVTAAAPVDAERRVLPVESGSIEDRIARYEDKRRAEWQRPDDVIRVLDLPRDAKVVDLGSGSGYFAVRLARAVPEGRVLALDVEPRLVKHVAERARSGRIANLEARRSAPDDPGLAEGSVDLVLMVNVVPFIPDRPSYLGKLRHALRPGGRLVVINLGKESIPGSPYPSRGEVVREAAAAGFSLLHEHGFLPMQYFLEFGAR